MNGLESLKKIEDSYREQKEKLFNDPFIHLHELMWFLTVGKELKDYHEIKEIAEHYHWDDLVKDTHMVDTDEKYRLLFNAAIPSIQADYRKARAFDIIISKEVNVQNFKSCLSVGLEYHHFEESYQDNNLWEDNPPYKHPMTEEEFDLLKEALK